MANDTLSVLSPVTITSSMLTSSTVPESDYAAYNAGTTYTTGDRVISTTTHRVYESLRTGNVGKDPTDITNRVGTAPWWLDLSPTNRWAMFDGIVSTKTIGATPLTVVINNIRFNSFYLAGLDAAQLRYVIKDFSGGTVIKDVTVSLEDSSPPDYYEYFYDPYKRMTDYLVSGLDSYASSEITITLSQSAGNVSCGILALGDLRPLGTTLMGATAKPKTTSYIKIDEYGNNVIKRRKSAKDMQVTALLELADANNTLEAITELLDVPCVWVATDGALYSGLRVYGLGSADLAYDNPNHCTLTLSVQGLI